MMLKTPPPSTNSRRRFSFGDAGWSSPVARQAHNLKVAGSNPAPATSHPIIMQQARNAATGARGSRL